MLLQARKPALILLTTLLLRALATACTALSVFSSQPTFPGVQEGTPEPIPLRMTGVYEGKNEMAFRCPGRGKTSSKNNHILELAVELPAR